MLLWSSKQMVYSARVPQWRMEAFMLLVDFFRYRYKKFGFLADWPQPSATSWQLYFSGLVKASITVKLGCKCKQSPHCPHEGACNFFKMPCRISALGYPRRLPPTIERRVGNGEKVTTSEASYINNLPSHSFSPVLLCPFMFKAFNSVFFPLQPHIEANVCFCSDCCYLSSFLLKII